MTYVRGISMETNKIPPFARRAGRIEPKDVKYATIIAFLAWVFAVYDFILFGTLLPEIGKFYRWNSTEQAALATWVAVGTAIVAVSVGPVVDKLGRRAGIILTVSGAAICSFLTAIGGSLGKGVLTLIRSLAGTGYAEQTVNATYLTEMYVAAGDPTLDRRKGFIYSLVQGGWPIGALIAAGLTAVLLPLIGWQGCFVFAAIPSLMIAFLARKLKKTPQFEASREIARLRRAGKEAEARALNINYEEHQAAGFGAVFRGEALRATVAIGGAFLLNWFAIQVFAVLGTTVITSVHNVTFQNSLIVLLLSNVIGYCGYLMHGFVGDKIGRRNAIAIGWMISGLVFTGMFGPSNFGVVVLLYSIGLFFLIGPYAALLFFIGESYPTVIRATGGSLINATGPIGAILAGLGATMLLSNGSNWQTAGFFFGALSCFISRILVLFARQVGSSV
jgi:MFS family permease